MTPISAKLPLLFSSIFKRNFAGFCVSLESIRDVLLGLCSIVFGVLAVLQRVLSMFPFVRIPSIADDMTLVSPQLDVTAAFVELKIGLGEIGLSVAAHKCKAICAT